VSPSTAGERRILALATAFVVPSGAAALIYQVVWVRLLGLSMGAASASVATVVAAFFLGLAVGSALAPRWLRRSRDPLAIYCALEAAIAVFGLLLLPGLLQLDALVAVVPGVSEWAPVRFTVALLLLVLPTICMGATYPVVVAWAVRGQASVGHGLSLLYAANTAGAVLGALGSGFVLIPWLGLDGAVVVAAALNGSVALVAVLARRRFQWVDAAAPQVPEGAESGEAPLRGAALLALAGTGLGAVANEVGWTHVLSILTGTTLYGFSAILGTYLTGMAVGSFAVRRRLATLDDPARVLAAGLVLLAFSLITTRAALSLLPVAFESARSLEGGAALQHAARYAMAGALILLPTLLYGALFPLSLQLYTGTFGELRSRVGRAYAVNTLAGLAGSLLAAFVAIPYLGTDVLLTSVALATALLPFALRPALSPSSRRALIAATVVFGAFAWLAPHLEWRQVLSSVHYAHDEDARADREHRYLYLAEGHSGVVSVVTYDDKHAKILNNGLTESLVCLEDPDHEILTESLLGLVPWMLHREPRRAFVIGLGGGVTTRALARTDLERIRVVELEGRVVEALRSLGGPGELVLFDPRIDLAIDDARHRLLLEDEGWDLIVSQPSHPWRSGAASLFTQEFFELVDARLAPGGIFGQWINLFQMDADTLAALLGTFFGVFDHGFVFINRDAGDLLVFGSDTPLLFDAAWLRDRLGRPAVARLLAREDVREPLHLLRWFALSRREALVAAEGSELSTDTNILSEVRLARLVETPSGDQSPDRLIAESGRLDVLPHLAGSSQLDALARYLFRVGEEQMARQALGQLSSLQNDEARAR